jgi:hypothetical protein
VEILRETAEDRSRFGAERAVHDAGTAPLRGYRPRARVLSGKHSSGPRRPRVAAGLRYRPGGEARRAATGRSLRHKSDHPVTPGWVIASDGEHSCAGVGRRDRFATHPSVSDGKADVFRHLGALRRALGINGKQASVILAGIRGSRRAWRTCAFCESARQHACAGWTLAALAFAHKRALVRACMWRRAELSRQCGGSPPRRRMQGPR